MGGKGREGKGREGADWRKRVGKGGARLGYLSRGPRVSPPCLNLALNIHISDLNKLLHVFV